MNTCQHCRVGLLERKSITYATWNAGHFITVPNTPAWQCDVCAYCEVDAAAMQQLLWLLGPATPADQSRLLPAQQSTAGEPTPDDFDSDQRAA